MAILALDTATEVLSIALADDSGRVKEYQADAGRLHLEMLLPAIHELLGETGLDFVDVEAIVAGIGPGTFSGLRVGVATARALAQALGIPIAASSTLDALARGLAIGVNNRFKGLLPLVDARRGQVFTCLYRIDASGGMSPVAPVVCIDPEAVPSYLAEHINEPVIAGGNGARAYRERLGSGSFELIPDSDSRNDIRAANHLPHAGFIQYHGPEDLQTIEPVYVREPDADKTALLRKREPWLR